MKNRLCSVLTLLLLVATSSLYAQPVSTWQPTGGGDWTDPLNWDSPPSPGDEVVFGTVDGTITNIPAGFTVSDLRKNGPGTVTLAGDLNITRDLIIDDGALVFGTGTTVTFNGTSTSQSIGSATFDNLVIDKPSSTSTTIGSPFNYVLTNPISAVGNLTVNGTMSVLRGVFSFCSTPSATFTHNLTNLVIGGSNSTVTIDLLLGVITSNTEVLLTNAINNANVTVNVSGNLTATTVAPIDGGITLAMVSPNAGNGGTCTLNVAGNFNVTVRMIMGGNGFRSGFSPVGPQISPVFNLGTANTAGTGNFVISDPASVYVSNTDGPAGLPTFTFVGGTTASPATYNVPFSVFGSNLGANASRVQNINGVYSVPTGSSVTIADRIERFLQLNGTLIIENGGGIDAMTIGSGATNPRMFMAPNARLIVRSLPGLGDGTGPTAGEFAINQASGGNPWDLISLQTNGTIEYAATTAGVQNVNPFTYNVLEINRPTGSYMPPTTFTNPNVATGNLTIDTLRLFRGILRLTNAATVVRNHTVGTLEIGSTGSVATILGTNTAIFVNSHNNGASSTLTITGNTTVRANATGVAITAAGAITATPTFGPTTLTFEGNLTTLGISSLQLAVNAAVGSTIPTLNLRDTVQLSSGSRINLNPSGTVGALINLGGSAPMLFDVQPTSLLGTPGSPSNARGSYVIVAGSEVVLPSGAAIAVMNPGTLTVNGALTCQEGSELISTLTGSGSGTTNFTLGTSGTIRLAKVEGLGDGTLLNPVSNIPLFIRRTAPSSGTPGNWVISSINSAGTIEYNGTGQTVTPRNTPNNYFNLAFSGSGSKTLGGDVDVANSLALNGGVVSTGIANLLRVNSTGATAITRTAGHINGRLQRAYPNSLSEVRFFPVGDTTTYRPISLEAGTGAIVPLEVRLVSGDAGALGSVTAPLQLVSGVRYYDITNNSLSDNISISQVEDMQVSGDDGVVNPSSIRVATRTTGNWAGQGGSISSVPSLITSTAFSESLTPSSKLFVALGSESTDNPLPVELLSFTGTSTVQGVKLGWETASESESNGFTVLRRVEGENAWTEVSSYQSDNALRAQNALNGASYSFTDKSLLEVGKSYEYQLRETGFDGQVVTLETITLTIRFNTTRMFELAQNYPNPFNPTTSIRYQIPTAETVNLKVYDILGKEVATLVNGRQEAGNYTVPFNAVRLASGVYFYRLQAGGFVETRKMLLVK
jgi:hypothetical protein